ncbi:glycerophosphoryl diester phosphodiesterase [Anaerosolibacter carboniphilus]|uniref:Glycerophosphoryl diester phosphodiesterase n=1 Tax=Anaerosolibacter carboniphilus TaxID=1417629 RepID=A0A841L4A2_9FIRM|nr:glycerophosphodiester phosphodiesterase [Anaerosolibacter carboniphilus]MBB6218990.1 glycerophosphoryl diester phosphodiesterase [Anaerosolibacter carboniphilus]
MKRTHIFAHRGASGYAPENTMAAFQKALEMGADGIELDVHLSKDGRLIVCHDETLQRTTNGMGWIKDMTLEEIRQYDGGSWFSEEYQREKVPVLEEVLDLIQSTKTLLNVEIKNGIVIYPGIERKVINLIRRYALEERTIISSFYHYSLVESKRIDPFIKTGALYVAGWLEPWEYARKIQADALHPIYHNIDLAFVEGCRSYGIDINTYTVNEEADMARLAGMGVAGIITNHPDRGVSMMNQLYENTRER